MKVRWSKEDVYDLQRVLKARYESYRLPEDAKQRFSQIMVDLDDATTRQSQSEGRLEAYCLAMTALVHGSRWGGVDAKSVERLFTFAESLLKVQGIRTKPGPMSFLYADLYLITSKLFRKKGDHWRSHWLLLLSERCTQRTEESHSTAQELAESLRLLRSGDMDSALLRFDRIIQSAPDSAEAEVALLAKVKAYRLMGQFDEAIVMCAEHFPSKGPRFDLELRWERACLASSQSGDYQELVTLVRARNDHSELEYILEAKLWAYACKSRHFQEALPKSSYLLKRYRANEDHMKIFGECVQTIESLYDKDIPTMQKLRSLGEVLERRSQLISLDKELLVLAAASRWLYIARHSSFLDMVLKEYRKISQFIRCDNSPDALQILTDIFDSKQSAA